MDQYVELLRVSGAAYVGLPVPARHGIITALAQLHRDTIEEFAGLMFRSFAEGFKTLELKQEDATRLLVSRYIDRYGARQAAQIIDTTQQQVYSLITGGLTRGEAVSAVFGNFINKIPEIADGRAKIITQTEVHAAGQYASQRVAELSSIPLKKIWATIKDERTRGGPGRLDQFNHWVMDGTTVALSAPYAVPTLLGGLEMLQFPGDPSGSAGNVINCRCVQLYERADR
jgi:uncharacterized protein with gpF-like domain